MVNLNTSASNFLWGVWQMFAMILLCNMKNVTFHDIIFIKNDI